MIKTFFYSSIFALAIFFGSPYYALSKIASAIENNDEKYVIAQIDFPSMHKSVTQILKKEMGAESSSGKFDSLKNIAVEVAVEKLVETMITPQAVIALMKCNAVDCLNPEKQDSSAAINSKSKSYSSSHSIKWDNMNTITIDFKKDEDKNKFSLVLSRDKVFDWKFSGFKLNK